jgi:hypothetical protein
MNPQHTTMREPRAASALDGLVWSQPHRTPLTFVAVTLR